jgi:hypothetical protein
MEQAQAQQPEFDEDPSDIQAVFNLCAKDMAAVDLSFAQPDSDVV